MSTAQQDIARDQIRMDRDYTTSSFGTGERTYKKGCTYQMTPGELKEIEDAGAGSRVTGRDYKIPADAPVRPIVLVRSLVTRKMSANGLDQHTLVAGQVIGVPSNLAAHLIASDQAEAV